MTKLPEIKRLGSDITRSGIYGYTEAQMLQFRRDALEEAAEMCELFDATDTKYIATAIRKIKDEK